MERGECDGWLHILISENDPLVKISIKHKHCHPPYEGIDLPEKWQQFIQESLEMSLAKVQETSFIFISQFLTDYIYNLDLAVYSHC